MNRTKLDRKLSEKSDKIIEKLSEIREVVGGMSDEIKMQTIEYIQSLIAQVEDFEKETIVEEEKEKQDEDEKRIRTKLSSPEKWRNVALEDIPLKQFRKKK